MTKNDWAELIGQKNKALEERLKEEKNTKIYKRLLFIKMKEQGMLNTSIASILKVTIDTLTDWTSLFVEGGLEALCQLHYEDRRVSKLQPYGDQIKKRQEEEGFSSLKQIKAWVEKEYGVETCISNLFYFCKKNSIFLTKKLD